MVTGDSRGVVRNRSKKYITSSDGFIVMFERNQLLKKASYALACVWTSIVNPTGTGAQVHWQTVSPFLAMFCWRWAHVLET
jgi:hypothetical protein